MLQQSSAALYRTEGSGAWVAAGKSTRNVMEHRATMKLLEKMVYKYLKARGWNKLRPADVAKSIMIEGAELLELFQWENLPLEEVKRNKKLLKRIKKELADVLVYSLDMAVLLGIDVEKIVRHKLAHIGKKYPAKLMKQTKVEPGTEHLYWRIKKAYRKRGL